MTISKPNHPARQYVIVETRHGHFVIDDYPCRNLPNGLLMARQLNGNDLVEVYYLNGEVHHHYEDGRVVVIARGWAV